MFTRVILFFALASLMVAAVFPRLVREFSNDHVMIDVLDVGQGDSILISDGESRVLIDGGPGHAITESLPDALPLFASKIDVVVLTHPHADHIDGLFDVMTRYQVGTLIIPNVEGVNGVGKMPELLRLAKDNGVEVRYVVRGDEVEVGGMGFDVYAPEKGMRLPSDLNAMSVVLSLRDMDNDGDDEGFFTGDAGFVTEDIFFTQGVALPRVELLKVGHHGSATASGDVFLQALQPRWAVISAAEKNRYGHPTKVVLTRLKNAATQVVMTKDNGTATFLLDGGCLHLAGSGGGFFVKTLQVVFLNKTFGSCTIAPN